VDNMTQKHNTVIHMILILKFIPPTHKTRN